MRAGAKDRQITLQRKTVARDSVGEPVETWADVRRLWAQRVEGSIVQERFAGDQTYAEVTTIFRVGYFPALTTISPDTHRIVAAGKIYNVKGAVELGRKDGVELLCVARGEN